MLRAQCKDREALELLLTAVSPALARYLSGLVDAADAEDVLQDVLLIIYKKLTLLEQRRCFARGRNKADIRLVLIFAVVSLSAGTAAAANALHLRIAQVANRILKAIELSSREGQ